MFNQQNLVKWAVIALFSICSISAFAQKRAHVVYVEALGNAVFYSVNYDVRFAQSGKGLGLSLGMAPLGIAGQVLQDVGVATPIQLNYVTGEKHALEIGAGILTGFNKTEAWAAVPNACVMYRYQGEKGFNFRIGWTPAFLPKDKDTKNSIGSNRLFTWGGMSLGYRF